MAQTMRAILFASATAATILGLRASSRPSQLSGNTPLRTIHRILLMAPTMRSLRISLCPILLIPPSRALPPVERCRGTRRKHGKGRRRWCELHLAGREDVTAIRAFQRGSGHDAVTIRTDLDRRITIARTRPLRLGRAPKRLLVYRTSSPFRGIRRAPLEVLCLGQQFVAYAVHPDTGQPYAWPEDGLSELDLESLPVIDAEMAAAFMEEALALVPPELRPTSLSSVTASTPAVPAHAQVGIRLSRPASRRSKQW